MAYRVLLVEQAEHDISNIHHYIAVSDSRAVAYQVVAELEAACASLGLERLERLKPLKDALPAEITYDEIRLVVARLRRDASRTKT